MARITVVAAARPNFMKVAPVIAALDGKVDVDLVHTGQHYDHNMSQQFFDDLGILPPDVNLEVGSGSHAEQTAGVMVAFEQHLLSQRPDAVVVVGDVNSTLAAALVASKLEIPVAHVEAGLRSRDWSMPEEINRVVTDRLSTWLFTPSEDADENLLSEGVPSEAIHRVGNVMIDTLLKVLPEARGRAPGVRRSLGVPDQDYAVLTLHRPANVDGRTRLMRILEGVGKVASRLPVLFPIHPRTRRSFAELDVCLPSGAVTIDPLGYTDFIALMDSARVVLTDSGGIQEETSVLGVPCVTLRNTTERPVTCSLGTNTVVGEQTEAINRAVSEALEGEREPAHIPLWDGHAGERIAGILHNSLTAALGISP